MEEKSNFETVLKWAVLGILAIVALRIALVVVGVAIGLASFLLFTVLPLVLVVWLVVKAVQWLNRPKDGGYTSSGL
jgi:high-affinity Fe2+/Pb2+ permease